MKVTLQSVTPNAEVNIVEIARVSSSRVKKDEFPEKLINYLIENKHWSPFQHAYMTVEIVTSKAIGIQYLRHLSFTFQEFSQRYAKVTAMEPIEFRLQAVKNRQSSTIEVSSVNQLDNGVIVPLLLNHDLDISEDIEEWTDDVADALNKIFDLYDRGIDLGIAKECVRMILPMATQTTLYMTGSVRSWIHLLDIRDDSHAQLEAQLIAKEIKKIFIEQFPIISKAREWKE